MADFKDAGHRPHAAHAGEEPRNRIAYGPEDIRVTLDTWGPQERLFPALYDALQSNWGESPSRTVERDCDFQDHESWEHRTGWCVLDRHEKEYIEMCFAGRTLQQALERLTFSFTIDGISRACTHQLVRTRLGAAFMQHGGRDNDWRHRTWTMPETIRRAIQYIDSQPPDIRQMKHCVTDRKPIDRFLAEMEDLSGSDHISLFFAIEDYLDYGRKLYSALVDAGIPYQDARRLLWMGTQTYIHADYNWPALKGVIGKRGEPIMDWEINCVAQLMQREINIHCPPVFGEHLKTGSAAAGRDVMAGLESWTPTGHYTNPYEICECGHLETDHGWHDEGDKTCSHTITDPGTSLQIACPCVEYRPVDAIARTNRPEQNPFWILSPDAMAGGPVYWIPTNGRWPKELR